ncbi:peptidase T [Coprothermobacter proteolyticus]|uniref:peptidase T n=1 Tax=Coprothermobacter proteolyticus TaxID=35786 RepID=UPI000AE49085|nr:peptidase T [Coprothermobacter proteolyticus]NLT83576.1 peptidase T [Coprothermobacter proteolyticus]
MREKLVNRFLQYVSFDTQSDENSSTYPSTAKQLELAKYLVEELKTLGLKDAAVDQYGYVTATLPGNVEGKDVPVIGFLAHMDTSPEFPGANVKPRIIENYDGQSTIKLGAGRVLSPEEFPHMRNYVGKTLITTDGTTLLGADDKAGIAEIVTAVEYLLEHPEIKHGAIKVGFTPDEEVGRGVDYFDVKKFGADFAFTLDGGELGELSYETFNAAQAKVTIHGKSIHPGEAKNKMKNAILMAMDYISQMPPAEAPAHTEGYEGFYHVYHIEGGVDRADLTWIIRDHHRDRFEQRKTYMMEVATWMNEKYGDGTFEIDVKDQYYNLYEVLKDKPEIIELAKKAMKEAGIDPIIRPVRGGTDGSRLTFMGLPTPNLFTGGHNYHGPYEYIVVESMEKAVEVIINIATIAAQGA